MDKFTVYKGLVGMYDILGYQAFLENNTPEAAAQIVVQLLCEVEARIVTAVLPLLDNEPYVHERLAKFQWLIFSDTILVTIPTGDCKDQLDAYVRWGLFLLQSGLLWCAMFESGLPIRGAIQYGDYVAEPHCLTGRPIPQAHQCGDNLELSACAILPEAYAWAKSITSDRHFQSYERFLHYDFPLPVKRQLHPNLRLVNPFFAFPQLQKKWRGNLAEIVTRSFSAHKKTVTEKVQPKIDHTVASLSFLKSQFPDAFD